MLFGKYTLRLQFVEDAYAPPYKGSMLRGAFGGALKTVMCGSVKKDCQECRLLDRCLYARVFETHERGTQAARPHPYVIEPPLDATGSYAAGESLEFGLLLFGKTNDFLMFFLHAAELMGKRGLGKGAQGRANCALESVCDEQGRRLYRPEDGRLLFEPEPRALRLQPAPAIPSAEVAIRLHTPFRQKSQNRLLDELPFQALTRAMLRRISGLFEHYGDGEPDIDYRGLVARAAQTRTLASELRWRDWERYSNRQQSRMQLGGLVGSVRYADVPAEYLPLLELSQLVHLGKQTTFGLGLMDFHIEGANA